jgi:hypothetical protein
MKGKAVDSVEQLSRELSSSDQFNGGSEGGMVREELQMKKKREHVSDIAFHGNIGIGRDC